MIPELAKFKACLAKHFIITDWQAIDIVVAAAVSHKLGGEMLWLRVIGASGSGKTEILRTLYNQTGYVETLETLTPSAIRRGFKPMRRNKETDKLEPIIDQPTLVQRINGRLVITKELAPLMTRQHEARLEIFGLLRSLHDGELDADYGSLEGHVHQKCCFDWILGTTGQVDSENQLEMQLGSRFTDMRWNMPDNIEDAIVKAVGNMDNIDPIRDELSDIMASIIARADKLAAKRFNNEYMQSETRESFAKLCHILAVLRTPVVRDRRGRDVVDEPLPESGTRIGQSFAKIAKGLYMLGIEDVEPYLVRMAWDGLPRTRRIVLKAIHQVEQDGNKLMEDATTDIITSASQRAIAKYSKTIDNNDGTGLSQQTISTVLDDLRVLKTKQLPWREYLCQY
jgi:hypothetical protein